MFVACINSSCFLITGHILRMCHGLFIHSFLDGHVGHFHLLTITDKAAVHIHANVFVRTLYDFLSFG